MQVRKSDLRIPFPWTERRSILLEKFLYIPAFYDRHEQWEVLPWSDPRIFGNDSPVYLEYCSGNGQWIAEKAKLFPMRNWIAVEKKFERARQIWMRLKRENLSNLLVVCGDGLIFSRYYAKEKSIAEVFVNFPDPWPKLRHAKHRLVRPEFLEQLTRLVEPKGKALFVTDHPPYAFQMLSELAQCSMWQPLLLSPHFAHEWPNYGKSFFSELWEKKGSKIHYLPYERRPSS